VLRNIFGHEWEAVEGCIMRKYITCGEKCIQNFRKRSLRIPRRIILEWILRKWGGEFLV
jgi:hypothetical protein